MKKKINNIILITRPVNVLLTFISVWLAAFLSPKFEISINVLFAALAASFILAGANVINDIFDFEIDLINRPKRPLITGILSKQEAWIIFSILYFSGLLCAIFIGFVFFLIAIVMSLLLIWYSSHLKRTVLWGNILVSFAGAITFIYGALAVEDYQSGVIPAAFAFFFHFGREVLKDMQDIPGDISNNVHTFPGRYGIIPAITLINILFIILILLTILPYIFEVYSTLYLIVVVTGVDLVLLFVMFSLWIRQDRKFIGILSTLLKVDMFVGLTAIWLGAHNVTFIN